MIPTDIAGLKLWLKADALSLNDNDAVATWSDSSGNGIDATQGTAGSRPTFKTSILNNKPVVRFDNTDDALAHAYPLGTATDFSLFLVINIAALASYGAIVGRSGATYWGAYAMHHSADGIDIYTGSSEANRVEVGAYLNSATWYSLSLIKSGTGSGNLSLRKNGGDLRNNSGVASDPTSSSMIIGRNPSVPALSAMNADIAEIILYDSALSDNDRVGIEAYITTKWFTAPSPSFRINKLRPAFFKPGLAR